MSVTGKQRTSIGLDRTGRPRRGSMVPAGHPNALITHPHAAPKAHSGMQDQQNAHATLGKTPKVKRAHVTAPPVHNGMATRSRDTGAFHFGGDALSQADANPANPLGGAPRAKNLTPPQASFGQRSRLGDSLGGDAPGANHKRNVGKGVRTDLGNLIIQQALKVAGPDHPGNMGIAALPDSNSEN